MEFHICAHVFTVVCFWLASWNSEELFPMCVLQSLMGGGGSFSAGGPGKGMYSRLYLNVLNRYHWIHSCNVFNEIHSDSSLFGVHGVTDFPNASKLADVLVTELKGMADPALMTEEALNRAKNSLRCAILMNLEQRDVLMEDIGRQLLVYGKRHSPETLVSKIEAVSAKDVLSVAQKMLHTSPSIVVRGDTTSIPHHPDLKARLSA